MTRNTAIVVVASLLALGETSNTQAQQLVEMRDVQVKPGHIAQYEAAVKKAVAFRQANAFPFPIMGFQAEPGMYRFVTFLNDWDGRQQIDDWFAPLLTGEPSAFVQPLFEATEHTSVSYQRARPDLTHAPDSPPVTVPEAGVMHELRLFPMTHTTGQVADVLERFATVYETHAVPGSKFVWQLAAGSEGPMFTQYFPSADSASYYDARAAALESMGGDFQALLQELAPLLRKTENVHWTSRPDLGYQP